MVTLLDGAERAETYSPMLAMASAAVPSAVSCGALLVRRTSASSAPQTHFPLALNLARELRSAVLSVILASKRYTESTLARYSSRPSPTPGRAHSPVDAPALLDMIGLLPQHLANLDNPVVQLGDGLATD